MKTKFFNLLVVGLIVSCQTQEDTYKLAFGSCNNQVLDQSYWQIIQQQQPDAFVWGGDNIYADTKNMDSLKAMYQFQKQNPFYKDFLESINYAVYATWDDHDYGLNDGGKDWKYKYESQQAFLDFINVTDENRRQQDGIYHAQNINIGSYDLKLYLLDTRFFRDSLKASSNPNKRYESWQKANGSILGNAQWQWLEKELESSDADFNIIVSSIQFLSHEHGFETWGNFPHEVESLKTLLVKHQVKNTILLSGDRHISEFSKIEVDGLNYDLYDFTSSGLTHAYTGFTSEPNQNRVGKVVSQTSFGTLNFDFKNNSVLMQMKSTKTGETLQEQLIQF
ncbi:alkaline phosphatase D family protein [Psychroflexus sp. ALD_RP9]|uniref:alkaline phosphatase D family protein n=1 Tax=Psychroflexus sp. ALD_RP9 TaxID=2777186 RepID=UPI001A8E0DD2|nr:alkaline phosphatase D family protein [Psychroflexus sp. ALD_RP9]QSS97182.1 alkaline phosphatase family protein [Psychroflexus sp. ALD_RP9]